MISDNPDISKAQEQRMRDALRLAQTKLKNIQDSLDRLHSQQDSLRRFHTVNTKLEEHSRRLFILNKEHACLAHDASEMERFETFESIMAPFLRMNILEEIIKENRLSGNQLEQSIHDIASKIEEQKKNLAKSRDAARVIRTSIPELYSLLTQCHQHDGAIDALNLVIPDITNSLKDIEEWISVLTNNKRSIELTIQESEKRIEALQTKRQTLEAHETMIRKGEAILVHLERLQELEEELDELNKERQETQKEQTRINEILGNLYKQYQETEQSILSLRDELGVHRTNIHGMQSYTLQENAMKLKNRHQMLLAAQSLWRRISSGYTAIEEKNARLNALRLDIEQLEKNVTEMRKKVGLVRQLAKEKEYTFNISKSQNVIQLRSDLEEGVACSVCGATHHPYHSDTMLDQSKLISEFRSDYELFSGELSGNELQLAELTDSLAKAQGQQAAELKNLESVRQRQSEDVNEWRIFASLDASFQDCSVSTNRDARMSMIRQLIENTQKDATLAQKELDEYNYHRQQIEQLSLHITALKSQSEEQATRMNEMNTACQVIVRKLEYTEKHYNNIHDRYHSQYKQVASMISLPEWNETWQKNHETLIMQIMEMMSKWESLSQDLAEQKSSLDTHMALQEQIRQSIISASTTKECIQNCINSFNDQLKEHTNSISTLMHGGAMEGLFEDAFEKYQTVQDDESKDKDLLSQMLIRQSELTGALSSTGSLGEELDEKIAQQRRAVDMWMHAYNSSHPPVQYSELSSVLTQDRDWNDQRKRIRDNQMQLAMEQSRVDDLRAQLVAMGAETGNITSAQASELQISNISQIEELEAKKRDTVMQIAQLQLQMKS